MDGKTKNKIGRAITAGTLVSGGMGFLTAIFSSDPWYSYTGMIIGFAIGGAGFSFWVVMRRISK
jgi:F0F1-type ATP synthase assembly protein I